MPCSTVQESNCINGAVACARVKPKFLAQQVCTATRCRDTHTHTQEKKKTEMVCDATLAKDINKPKIRIFVIKRSKFRDRWTFEREEEFLIRLSLEGVRG
jgi:hypothetical protein